MAGSALCERNQAITTPSTPIAFIDLAAQQARIRDRIDQAIARVLAHGQYIMGPEIALLEQQLAAFSGARHAITCASGTDALLIAMMALGVGRGDAVLCPAFTFTATAETIALLGATPVFVDVDADTFTVDPDGLLAGLETARTHGLRPTGLIAADLFGLPADYRKLQPFAQNHGLFLLSDAAQSFGADLHGQRVGTFATITTTSFFPAKPLGCYGDGGALLTNEDELAARMRSIRLHGKARGGEKYDIERIGLNGRLDTIQAAVLLEKLAIFEDEIARRRKVAQHYNEALRDFVTVPTLPTGAHSVWAQYTIRLDPDHRSEFVDKLKAVGIPTAIYYPRPLHQQTAYRSFPVASSGLAVSERLSKEVLSLPMHAYLETDQQDWIIDRLLEALAQVA